MNPDISIGITGTGSYVPRTSVGNEVLAKLLDTDPEAIYRVTGIRQRRLRDEQENIYVMCAAAGLQAIEDAGLRPADIDAMYCGVDPFGEMAVPAAANLIQYVAGLTALKGSDETKAPNYCPSYDVIAGCCSPLFALEAGIGKILADRNLLGKQDTKVLVIAGDSMSNVVNWEDRETAMIFADGAGAVVVEDLQVAAGRQGVVVLDDRRPAGILSIHLASDGEKSDLICQFSRNVRSVPGQQDPVGGADQREYLRMKGAEVYRHATRRLTSSLQTALGLAGLSEAEIDLYIPHQANLQILRKVFGERMSQDGRGKVYTRGIVLEGNCSAGTIFVALDKLHKMGRLAPGMTVAMPTFGAGLAWGTVVFRWHKPAGPRLGWEQSDNSQRDLADRFVEELYPRYATMVSKMQTELSVR